MRIRKLTSVALVGCTALCGASLTSAASAALPELGRCIAGVKMPVEGSKTPKYSGAYANKGCTKLNAHHRGKYEWTPGPGAKNKFSAIAYEPEPVLETVGGIKVECTVAKEKGEYTGPKTEKVSELLLSGCTSKGKGCQSNPAKAGDIEATELEGTLGVVKGPPSEVPGWDLKKSGPFAVFTCGTTEGPIVNQVEGSVIGAISKKSPDLNKMSIESLVSYVQTHGKQEPEMFEGMPKDVLTDTMTAVPAGQKIEQLGLLANVEVVSGLGAPIEKAENQEALEIRTKPEEA